jgi:diguanylate cyclase (GGDEF)-like protein
LRYQPGQAPFPDAQSRAALRSFQQSHHGSLAINVQSANGDTIVWSTNQLQGPIPLALSKEFLPIGNRSDWLLADPRYAPHFHRWIIPMRISLHDASGKRIGFLGRPTPLQEIRINTPSKYSQVYLYKHQHLLAELHEDGSWGPAQGIVPTTHILRLAMPGYPWTLEMHWQPVPWWALLHPLSWLQVSLPFLAILILLYFLDRGAQGVLREMFSLRELQAAALAVQHRILGESRADALPGTFCDALLAETAIAIALLLQCRDGRTILVGRAVPKAEQTRFDACLLPRQAVTLPPTFHAALSEALHSGRTQYLRQPATPLYGSALGAELEQSGIDTAAIQPIENSEGGSAWGAMLCLYSAKLISADNLTPFLDQSSHGFAMLMGLWHRRDALNRAENRLQMLKDFDPLTGAANRRRLEQVFADQHQRLGEGGQSLAVAILDIDDFAQINKIHGRTIGDQLLIQLRERLQALLGPTDLLARPGGDEFVLLLSYPGDRKTLANRLQFFEEALQAEFAIGPQATLQVQASIGVAALSANSAPFLDGVLREANQALLEVKAHKQDREQIWAIYGEKTASRAQSRAQRLLAEKAVEVWYQPVIDGRNGHTLGVEALARLRDDDGRILAPGEFLPHLDLEQVRELSWLVLARALEDVAELEEEGWPLWFSFNVPAESFTEFCLPCLEGALANSRIPAERITIEILESSDFLDQTQAAQVMQAIRAIGINLALDDVGTAYASLQRLRDLPINKIKIDQGFVRELPAHPEDLHFIRTLQDLALETHVEILVEGVETAEILDMLVTIGIPQLQGYAISRPVPLSQLRRFLENPFSLQAQRPATLLGLYAGIMSIHSVVKKTLQPMGQQILVLGNVIQREGFYDQALSRLGYSPGDPLHIAYRSYQSLLSRALAAQVDSFQSAVWQDVEDALGQLQKAILAERQREILVEADGSAASLQGQT